jgi:hypothetical protein
MRATHTFSTFTGLLLTIGSLPLPALLPAFERVM